MKQDLGFLINEIDYSKKISECKSGDIVSKNEKRFLILNTPLLYEKEANLFYDIMSELKRSNIKIETKADIYFFLKEYCIENLILLNKEQREKLLYYIELEALNESILTPLLNDPDFEEIVINGANKPLMVYHKTFGWLESNASFTSENRIKNIINKMSSHLGRQLSYHTPLLNAVLKNGSRINASMNPIAFSGINCTIRKFKENPLTPADITANETISKSAMSFLWIAMQTSCSILICGNTGSGKTTTLNSLFCFLPKEERMVVVEETPELLLPQTHKIKLNTSDQLGIGLEKLIENTFRMRPDRVIVGEIRSPQEAKAFVNTMMAGQAKGSYATFHAESANEAIQRMISFGIEESALASLDLIVVQKRLSKINLNKRTRIEERKVVEISEIIKNEKQLELRSLFSYDFDKEKLKKVEESQRVLEKITKVFSAKRKEINKMMQKKEQLLEKLKDKANFGEFFEIAEREN
jgi:Flp pilus assembly CpaF family ATPase